MKPSLEQFLASSARWNGEHLGISYELSWHGRSEFSPEGTWCWYLVLFQEQFYPEDWKRLRLERQDAESFGSWRRLYRYENFPDCDPHGEWTFGEMATYLGRDGTEYERIKVGCDYAHSFDRDGGYWEGHPDVKRDVERSIEKFLKMFPNRKVKCAYSGKWDDADKFFETNAGFKVHVSYEGKTFDHPNWQRKAA